MIFFPVGIDVQTEYLFNDLDKLFDGPTTPKNDIQLKKAVERQTCITDTFKERKRKNTDTIDKTQSKEKKKRENAIIENFKYLKQSFETASKKYPHVNKPSKQTDTFLNHKIGTRAKSSNSNINEPCVINTNPMEVENQHKCENIDSDEFIDDEKIDSILNEIENEMSNSKATSANTMTSLNSNKLYSRQQNLIDQNTLSSKFKSGSTLKNVSIHNFNRIPGYKTISDARKRKPLVSKSNYSFIDLLERNLSLSDEDDKTVTQQKENGFSETIKSEIQKYLTNTRKKANAPSNDVDMLFENPVSKLLNEGAKINDDENKSTNQCPIYEIKEILGGEDSFKLNRNSQCTEDKPNENLVCNEKSKLCNIKNINNIEKQHKLNEVEINPYDSNIKAIRAFKTLHDARTTILGNEDFTSRNKYQESKKSYPSRLCVDETKSTNLETSSTNEMCADEKIHERILNSCNEINEHNLCNLICSVDDNNSGKDSFECQELNLNNLKLNDDDIIHSKEVSNTYCITNDTNSNELRVNRQEFKRFVNPCPDMNDMLCEIFTVPNSSNPSGILLNNPEIDKVYDDKPTNINISEKVSCSDTAANKNYQLLENKKGSDTLMIEDFGYNIDYNQAPFNMSACNPSMTKYMTPSSSLLNDNLNLARNSSVGVTCKRKSDYVNKYTYSTSKIDVCTKETPEYYVQVIKKVKMDLDITAIVSRKHSSYQNYHSKCEETPQNKNEASQTTTPDANEFIANKNDEFEGSDLHSEVRSARFLRSEFLEAENIVNTPNKSTVPQDNEHENLKMKITLIYENDGLGPYISTENKNQSKLNIREKQNPEIKSSNGFKEQENINVSNAKAIQSSIETEFDKDQVNEDNKIKNILQKYGKILGYVFVLLLRKY